MSTAARKNILMILAFVILILSRSVMKAIICFSPTTFMAVPKASAEVSRTVGSVKLGAIIRLSFLLQSPDYTVT
jgi:hypothetical protein